MSRELIYAVEGKAANLKTFAVDEPGHGGACHVYQIIDVSHQNAVGAGEGDIVLCDLEFQDGPISADGNGVNGIQHEDLLAVLIDRLRGFQSGPYACDENYCALALIEEALRKLQERTKARIARGVEGTHKV